MRSEPRSGQGQGLFDSEELHELRAGYRVLEQELPPPDPHLFARIQAAMAQPEPRPVPSAAPVPRPNPLWERLRGWFEAPRLAWGVAALQLAVITWLVAAPPRTGVQVQPGYQTLSAPADGVAAGARLNVMFQAETTEGQLRGLLAEIGAEIVAGPTSKGLYVVRLAPDTSAQTGIDRLQASGHTRFVAEAY